MKNNRKNGHHQTLPCDSSDYDIMVRAIKAIPNDKKGMTCEIGLRKGGGTGFIMDTLKEKSFPYNVHVAIDPYGDISYAKRDTTLDTHMDYTNSMRDEFIGPIYSYAMKIGVNFIFINLEDTEFFNRYSDGVPVYNNNKRLLSEYIFVHIDGPHQYDIVYNEFIWFNDRMTSGATMVFDDVSYYDHDKVESHIIANGWVLLEKTNHKASYQKT